MTATVLNHNQTFPKPIDIPDNGTGLLTETLEIPRFDLESVRLSTFKNWPNKNIDPKDLASAGFFYLGKADIVECYRCGIKGHQWVENDNPMEDHIRWNKNCPFVRQSGSENDSAPRSETSSGRDICGNLGVEICQNENDKTCNNLSEESRNDFSRLGIQRAKGPSHPDYITLEQRLATYENWPKSLKQKPPNLASSGFFYMGVGDKTLCFYCGGGLRDWDEEDDPWEQHALWFPKCNYLLLKKTQTFVDAVQRKHRNATSKPEDKDEQQTLASSSSSSACGEAKDCKKNEAVKAATTEDKEKQLDESPTLCKICYRNELGVVFLPCGHMVACADCASALKECAVCRKPIEATVRAFLS